MRAFFQSARFRLVLFIVIASLPALGLAIWSGVDNRRQATEQTQTEALRLSRVASGDFGQLIDNGKQLLTSLAQIPEIRSPGSTTCSSILAEILHQFPTYDNLSAVDPNTGIVYCSSAPLSSPVNISDRIYYQRVLETRQFTVSDYLISRETQKSSLILAIPAVDENGKVVSVLTAGLDLKSIAAITTVAELPASAALLFIDGQGTILVRIPGGQDWIGKSVPDQDLIKTILQTKAEGTADVPGIDGIRRLYAFTPVSNNLAPNTFVAIGFPVDEVYQASNRILERNLILLVITIIVGGGAAWIFSEVLFLRQIKALLSAARRFSQGDLKARAELETGPTEFLNLGTAFNDMATAIQQRESELKRAEQKLRETIVELGRSNRELQDFAYIASHDLQEPLRKVQAFSERLLVGYTDQLDEKACDYLQRMNTSASRMQVMINDLLTYSRVTTKAQPFIKIKLAMVIREVLSDLETRLEESDGKVEVTRLPDVQGDPTQIRQLLQNLIGNSLKFSRKGIPPVVKVSGATIQNPEGSSQSLVELKVEDNGIGFDEKYLDRIFQPFQRLHQRGEYEGSGIGLAICRKIVERHGGSITAHSNPNQGSTFIITLPATE